MAKYSGHTPRRKLPASCCHSACSPIRYTRWPSIWAGTPSEPRVTGAMLGTFEPSPSRPWITSSTATRATIVTTPLAIQGHTRPRPGPRTAAPDGGSAGHASALISAAGSPVDSVFIEQPPEPRQTRGQARLRRVLRDAKCIRRFAHGESDHVVEDHRGSNRSRQPPQRLVELDRLRRLRATDGQLVDRGVETQRSAQPP